MATGKDKHEVNDHNVTERNYDRSVSNALKGAWTKWLDVLTKNNLETHEECARFLIYWYDKYIAKDLGGSVHCTHFDDPIRSSSTNFDDPIRNSSTNFDDPIRNSSTNFDDPISNSSTNCDYPIRSRSHHHVQHCKGHSQVTKQRPRESVGTVTRGPDGSVNISFRVMSSEPECISVLVNGHHMLGSPFQHAQCVDHVEQYAGTNEDSTCMVSDTCIGVKDENREEPTVISQSYERAPPDNAIELNSGIATYVKEEIVEDITHRSAAEDGFGRSVAGSCTLENQMGLIDDDQTIATTSRDEEQEPFLESLSDMSSPTEPSNTKHCDRMGVHIGTSDRDLSNVDPEIPEHWMAEPVDNAVMNEYLQWRYAEDQTSIADDSASKGNCDSQKSPKRKRGRPRKHESSSNSQENRSSVLNSKRRQLKRKCAGDDKSRVNFRGKKPPSKYRVGFKKPEQSENKEHGPCFRCTSCVLRFFSAEYYDLHMQAHDLLGSLPSDLTNSGGSVEDNCGAVSSDKCQDSVSTQENADVRPQVQNLSLDVYDTLLEKYKETKRMVCPFPSCTMSLRHPRNFDQHIVRYHGDIKNSKFICPVDGCGKVLGFTWNLKSHMKYCHSERSVRKILCDTCGKGFKTSKCLWAHMTTHASKNVDRIYKCPVPGCKSDFALEKYLKQHEKTHRTDYDYLCHICGKSFKRDECLQAHYRSLNHKTRATAASS